MGSEAELEPNSTPKLPLFSIPPMQSPEPSGMLTPPLQTSASVPFRWEEEPGKPRPCTALITTSSEGPRCLELPPRLLMMYSKITKTPSPTTVLEGPYEAHQPPIFSASSFRFDGGSPDPVKGQLLGTVVLGDNDKKRLRGTGLFGFWRKKTAKRKVKGTDKKEEEDDGSFFFSSLPDLLENGGARVKMTRIQRNGSFSGQSQGRSHIWATIYDGFKQVIPWRSRKSKK